MNRIYFNRIIPCLLFAIFIVYNSNAQKLNIDSLKSKESTTKITPTEIINAFGKPTVVKEDVGYIYMEYHNENFNISFVNNSLSKIEIINYRGTRKHGLGISYVIPEIGNFYSGFTIYIHNFNKQPIKYLWITSTGINGVGDRRTTKTLKATGPIEFNESGTYVFDLEYDSKDIVDFNIDAIKVQYLNGQFKTFTSQVIKEIYLYNKDMRMKSF